MCVHPLFPLPAWLSSSANAPFLWLLLSISVLNISLGGGCADHDTITQFSAPQQHLSCVQEDTVMATEDSTLTSIRAFSLNDLRPKEHHHGSWNLVKGQTNINNLNTVNLESILCWKQQIMLFWLLSWT